MRKEKRQKSGKPVKSGKNRISGGKKFFWKNPEITGKKGKKGEKKKKKKEKKGRKTWVLRIDVETIWGHRAKQVDPVTLP